MIIFRIMVIVIVYYTLYKIISLWTNPWFVLVPATIILSEIYGRYEESKDKCYGTSKWLGSFSMRLKGLLGRKGIVLGKIGGKLIRFNETGHLLTCAPTGAGKGVSAVIPNLLDYEGSVVVNDIKGENYSITAQQRKKLGQEIYVLDPFGITATISDSINWLDFIDTDDANSISLAAVLADMLVLRSKYEDNHWNDAASAFLKGLILHVAATSDPHKRNICEVRDLVTKNEEDFKLILEDMANSIEAFGVISKSANILLQKADRERSSVISTIHRHTDFLDDPRIRATLKESTFEIKDIKDVPMSIYIVIPPDKLETYSRYIRSVISVALNVTTKSLSDPNSKKDNVLFLLDEFSQLGYMKPIEDAISLIRGYGVTMWMFVQDLSQLKSTYPKWETFLSNVNVKQFFGVSDLFTAQHISKMLGSKTVDLNRFGGTNETSRPLMFIDEVMKTGKEIQIIFVQGLQPIKANKVSYLKEGRLKVSINNNILNSRIIPWGLEIISILVLTTFWYYHFSTI